MEQRRRAAAPSGDPVHASRLFPRRRDRYLKARRTEDCRQTDAQRQRDPQDLPRVFRGARPRNRALEPARAAQRSDAAVHQRRHGAVQERVHRHRAAAVPARDHVAEVRARRRQAQRPRQRRLHRPAPHLLRDARQLLVRRLLQGRGDRARLEPGDQGVRPAGGPAADHGLCRGRRGVRAVAEDRGAAREPDPAHPHLRQFLGDGRHRAVRAVLGDLLRPRARGAGRAAGQPRRGRRPLHRDLEPGVHAVRADRARPARAAAQALDRYRHGPRAHRRGAPGAARQLRHRSVPPHHPGERGADRHARGRPAPPLAQGDRRSPARLLVPDRRRRHALERGARLRAAPDHAPRHAPRPYAGRARAADVAPRAGAGRRDGPGLPRAGARGAADHRGSEARGDAVSRHARARSAPARGGDRGPGRGR